MAVVFSLIFGRFALVFTAFCLYVAVPLVGGVFWGWVGGVLGGLRFAWPRCLVLRYGMFPKNFGRSWCYVVNFLPGTSHALDATLWTFFLALQKLLMLCCELLPRTSDALDATSWTFFLELQTLLMLRCELSFKSFRRSWCYVADFLPRTI